MHLTLSRRVALLLVSVVALTAVPVVGTPRVAVAAPVVHRAAPATAVAAPVALFRLRPSSRYRSPYRRTYPYGYPRRRSHGFARGLFHGLFWGWMLSHFFGGGYGFPLFIPFLLIVFALVALMRRRRRPSYRYRAW